MKIVICIPVLIFSLLNCFAQQSKKSSRFEDFSVAVYKGKMAPVNLRNHRKARMYRTMLRFSIKDGVNFAGHYIIARWGCGSNCITIAVIDVKRGTVFFPPEFSYFGVGFEFKEGNEKDELQYKPNSKLLIAEGILEFDSADNLKAGKYYFVWERNNLRLLLREKRQGIDNN